VFLHVPKNAAEQGHVSIDQIEPAFVGLAAQPGRNADDIGVLCSLRPGGGDPLIGGESGAVQQVESLSFDQFLIDIDEIDLANDAPELQGGSRTRADKSSPSNDRNLHLVIPVAGAVPRDRIERRRGHRIDHFLIDGVRHETPASMRIVGLNRIRRREGNRFPCGRW